MIEKILMSLLGVVLTIFTVFSLNVDKENPVSPLPTPKATIEYSFVDDDFLIRVRPTNYYTNEVARDAFLTMHPGATIQSFNDVKELKELGYIGYVAFYHNYDVFYTFSEPHSTWVTTLWITSITSDADIVNNSEESVFEFLKSLEINE